ncbi:3'(2'),5'-bisphosphate nucleotidase CysQ [Bordetella genomosp. 11]|uniref:3'(2'),5'-bisphosphate nucleotidase CysQ n=1 Tax=Bordetella genomosp. 11 TaxID=1416808 RepID=A0A261UPX1_9BORD|nr:3'(2'),5'-bisphosphate nucleotidase CysQ [Bordetella genomosp. 11]OZI62963.1 3'(2'),5'-bisphosphate nucleotidase [Bordetella genomosp. 11]
MLSASQLTSVLQVARDAGHAVMAVYDACSRGASPEVSRKADDSPVTEADMDSHRIIVAGLAALDEALPVVSEEDTDSHAHRTRKGRYWLVDPLDGTKEFLDRNGEFTVNIALIDNGTAVAGVVVAPALGLEYWGATGLGAWRDTGTGPSQLSVCTPCAASLPRVIASRSHLDSATQDYLRRLGPHSLVQAGSSLKFCRIAEGAADLYPRFGPTCEWDVAAAHAILEAAGGQVLCLDGTPLRYGKAGVLNPPFIASNGHVSV